MVGRVVVDIIPSTVGVIRSEESIGVFPVLVVCDGGGGVVAVGLTGITEPHEGEHHVTLVLGDGVVINSHLNRVAERLEGEWSEGRIVADVEETTRGGQNTGHPKADLRLEHDTTGQHSRLGGGLNVECDTAVALGDGVIHGGRDVLSTLNDGILDRVGGGEDIV